MNNEQNTRTRALKHANVKVQSIVVQLQDRARNDRKEDRRAVNLIFV